MTLYRDYSKLHILISGVGSAFLFGYLLLYTGVFSDDYIVIASALDERMGFLYPSHFIATPVLHYTHVVFYNVFKTNYILYDLLKYFG